MSFEIRPGDRWGPFVSERAWGTVREDYSANGDAWNYFPRDEAHVRAFRWGEDAIAGICDRYQFLVLAPVFWNGADPILKERLFGLSANEGNHGEDVKEVYFHLDATPDHSYLKYLYRYPQRAFPYQKLIEENARRTVRDPEYELEETGIFAEKRYFDITVEYAKVDPDDIVMRIEAVNCGPEAAPLHLLPQLWFRNQWSWEGKGSAKPDVKPLYIDSKCLGLKADDANMPTPRILLTPYQLGVRNLYGSPGFTALFGENETGQKDAFHRHLVQGEPLPQQEGTKAALHYKFDAVPAGGRVEVFVRLTPKTLDNPLQDAAALFAKARAAADAFYAPLHPPKATAEERALQRQAWAGLIWNKQLYYYSVGTWIEGDNPRDPPPPERRTGRNSHWRHLTSFDLFTMPDKWEFPWFAAWDTALQCIATAPIDPAFAKQQLYALLFDQFQHPNGAVPAYEWGFSDVNPPLQAYAILKILEQEKQQGKPVDYEFARKCYSRLLLNFSWWVNRVDKEGRNVFEGGFLGMDNIGLIDRSQELPPGFTLDQADGSGWMSLFCLNLMRLSLLLAEQDPAYEQMGIKFFSHFLYLTAAMRKGYWRHYDLWNEEDAFFYSVLRCPDGTTSPARIRSLVGIIPFFACDIWSEAELKKFPQFYPYYRWLIEKKPHLVATCVQALPSSSGTQHLFGLLSQTELRRFLERICHPDEFGSPHGLRSLSKYHEAHPVDFYNLSLRYEPGEAQEKIKGGNSNWRGPIWFPPNYLFLDTLHRLNRGLGNSFTLTLPDLGTVTLSQLIQTYQTRLLTLFSPPYTFSEYFHGDTGKGLGSSHQTGWTALIANLITDLRK